MIFSFKKLFYHVSYFVEKKNNTLFFFKSRHNKKFNNKINPGKFLFYLIKLMMINIGGYDICICVYIYINDVKQVI